MSTVNISPPDSFKEFVEQHVTEKGYSVSSDYVRELIRKDQDRQQLRDLLTEGARSALAGPADALYFAALRDSIRDQADD